MYYGTAVGIETLGSMRRHDTLSFWTLFSLVRVLCAVFIETLISMRRLLLCLCTDIFSALLVMVFPLTIPTAETM